LSCSIGTLTDLKYLGLQKNDNVHCTSIFESGSIDDMLVQNCYSDPSAPGTQVHTSTGEAAFRAAYKEKCKGKEACELTLNFADIKPACAKPIDERIYNSKFVTATKK
jgi:hypothetical protein